MSEKAAKPKKAKAKTGKDEAGVLGNLPATRASRVGGERSRARDRDEAARDRREAEGRDGGRSRRPRSPGRAPPPAPRRSRRTGRAPCERARRRSPNRRTARAPRHPSRREQGSTPPTGTELVTTAIQAAGELAQIGLTVGGQVLKRAVKRLPKP